MSDLENRCIGAFIGLACGDALGTTLEFKPPGSFEPITDMVGGGPFNLLPGYWTDDTSMALCLAMSFVETGRCESARQMQLYERALYHTASRGYSDAAKLGLMFNHLPTMRPR